MGWSNWGFGNKELGTLKDASFKVSDALWSFRELEAKMKKEKRYCGDISRVISELEGAVENSSLSRFLKIL